jgi:hypothetical protein
MRSDLPKALFFSLLGLSACGEEPIARVEVASAGADEVVDRQTAVKAISASVCDRIQQCNGFSSTSQYGSYDACKSDQEQKWADRWNDNDCTAPRHGPVAGKVRGCQQRAGANGCSGNILDQASEWVECRSGNVCR